MPTLSELRTRVRTEVPANSTDTVDNTALNTLLNEGALDMAHRADAYILSATFNTVANTATYVLSGAASNLTGFLELYWPCGGLVYTQTSGSTKTSPMDFTWSSEQRLDLEIPGWRDASASDTLLAAYLTYDSSGYVNLGLYPKSSSTTPSIKLYYRSRGTDMTADGHYPWTGSTTLLTHTEPFQKAIAFYALWQLFDTKYQIETKAERYKALYLSLCAECKMAQERVVRTEVEGQIMAARQFADQSFGSD